MAPIEPAPEEHPDMSSSSDNVRRGSKRVAAAMPPGRSYSEGEDKDDLLRELKRSRKAASGSRADATNSTRKKQQQQRAKCKECLQYLDSPNLMMYSGPAEGSAPEAVAITNEVLQITVDNQTDEFFNANEDGRPEYRLLGFSFYDTPGHLVPFDRDSFLPDKQLVFASGFLKAITNHSNETEDAGDAIPVEELGPLNWWWIHGYGGGEAEAGGAPMLGVSTDFAHYYLADCSPNYIPIMGGILQKALLAKIVVDRLAEAKESGEDLTFDDLLFTIESYKVPEGCLPLTSEALVTNASFVISQVLSFEESGDDDEEKFMVNSACIRHLLDLTGLKSDKKKDGHVRRLRRVPKDSSAINRNTDTTKEITFSKATTTILVRELFEQVFSDQLEEHDSKDGKGRKKRCGYCEQCLADDCGNCAACKDMIKFGGTGKSKQACKHRTCSNMTQVTDHDASFDGDLPMDEGEGEADDQNEADPKKGAGSKATSTLLNKEFKPKVDKNGYRNSVRIGAGDNRFKEVKDQLDIRDCFVKLDSLKEIGDGTKSINVKDKLGATAEWIGDPIGKTSHGAANFGSRTYYEKVQVGVKPKWTLSVGDFVYDSSGRICRILNLFARNSTGGGAAPIGMFAHLQEHFYGHETVLGKETADRREIFQLARCYTSKISEIWTDKVPHVKVWPVDADIEGWALQGNTEDSVQVPTSGGDEDKFYVRMRYDPVYCRFEAPLFDVKSNEGGFCSVCDRNTRLNVDGKVIPFDRSEDLDLEEEGKIFWSGFIYEAGVKHKVGEAVFLTPEGQPGGGGLPHYKVDVKDQVDEGEVDPEVYPEVYRKTSYVKGCNETTPKPFDVGIITEVFSCSIRNSRKDDSDGQVKVVVRKLYRPYQVSKALAEEKAFSKDWNLLYWSDEFRTVEAEAVRGKCVVRPEIGLIADNISVDQWTEEGTYRFYYNMAYSKSNRQITELPLAAETYGLKTSKGKSKGKGKGKGKSSEVRTKVQQEEGLQVENDANDKDELALPPVRKPLRTLDVFAGCGGLSLGLKQAGVSESKWAIEVCEPAAKAFKLNEPECSVFTDDCNLILKKVMTSEPGSKPTHQGMRLPCKGDVELLCGGPPCQGFSGMNRFNTGDYSKFKNSLISSYLSYCDYYRPKFFILENVRNFASFKKCMILKLCLRALVKMGYQCTFSIMQAGNFGVAQTRRRCILLAAAPGETLPLFPEPLHVFNLNSTLKVNINDVTYSSNCRWTESAPYRTITVRDAMSDLPPIVSGCQKDRSHYEVAAGSHFQKVMRRSSSESADEAEVLLDHICKEMAPLVVARMSYIPINPGADWRDLPNKVVRLSDGTWTDKLEYKYHDVEKGKGKNGALRGVCECAQYSDKDKKKKAAACKDVYRQSNTLIPWCLPHTSNRHNNWAGLYGRLAWNGFFSTTVTNPEPMGKQGRNLHPEQHRLVSVRECARSQGFPDSYKFWGNIMQKHRQIGNAVAPPMGKAIGLEIRKAMHQQTLDSLRLKTQVAAATSGSDHLVVPINGIASDNGVGIKVEG